QTTFAFKLATRVPAGSFDFLSSPSIFPPVFPVGYAATFRALFDSNFPDPSAVRFTGPTGSGLAGTPSDPNASGGDDTGSNFTYRSPFRSGIAPGGAWSVLYKGLSRIFSVPTFDANRSFVLIVPTVSLNTNQNLTGVTWYYADSSGNRLNGPPSFLGGLRLSIQMNGGGASHSRRTCRRRRRASASRRPASHRPSGRRSPRSCSSTRTCSATSTSWSTRRPSACRSTRGWRTCTRARSPPGSRSA